MFLLLVSFLFLLMTKLALMLMQCIKRTKCREAPQCRLRQSTLQSALHAMTYHATLAKLKLAFLQAWTDKSGVTVTICSLSAVNTASGSIASSPRPIFANFTERMKHQRCRCLGRMQPFHTHSNKMQLLYLSVQQSQCSIIVMQSEANQC